MDLEIWKHRKLFNLPEPSSGTMIKYPSRTAETGRTWYKHLHGKNERRIRQLLEKRRKSQMSNVAVHGNL